MRGTIPDLPTPHPLIGQLPVVYLEHDFLDRFLAALDEVLAPALLTLDNLAAHLDPRTAPADYLRWLAGWVAAGTGADARSAVTGSGAGAGPGEPGAAGAGAAGTGTALDGERRAVAAAVDRHRWRGTRRGLAELVRQETGLEPAIAETGGATWSVDPGELPAVPARAWVTVRLHAPDPGRLDLARLERLVAAEVPAHVGFTVEILPAGEQP